MGSEQQAHAALRPAGEGRPDTPRAAGWTGRQTVLWGALPGRAHPLTSVMLHEDRSGAQADEFRAPLGGPSAEADRVGAVISDSVNQLLSTRTAPQRRAARPTERRC